jgi:CubicO group peptidase (beta-lactamase class C family)
MLLAQHVDTIIADAIQQHLFPSAVVLVANDERVLHFAAYGATMYDQPGTRPAQRDTIYDVASLTKVVTATAALRLYDAGALDLHTPVATYLPDFRASSITVWHLLTHTSGLDIRLSTLRQAGRTGLLAAVYEAALLHPPGTRVAYTNVNSLLLGEIVARQYGATLDAAVCELVTDALGLQHTQFCPATELLRRIAPTEIDTEWRGGLVHGSVHDESAYTLGGVAGHAGLFSTAHDMYLLCRAWLSAIESRQQAAGFRHSSDTNILETATARLAVANHTQGLNAACGLGWMLDRPHFMGPAPVGSFGHTGFTGSAVVVIPKHRLIVVMLSNRVYPHRGQPHHLQIMAMVVRTALEHAAISEKAPL